MVRWGTVAGVPGAGGRRERLMDMSLVRFRTLSLSMSAAAVLVTTGATADTMRVAGWLERVRVDPEGFEIEAKLDSGADNSSIGAKDVEEFEKNGKSWVKFTVARAQNGEQRLERPIVRTIRVKRHGAESIKRYVVDMTLCLGDTSHKARVSLADRTNYKLPMLIGRSYLSGRVLVDSSKTYTSAPSCAVSN